MRPDTLLMPASHTLKVLPMTALGSVQGGGRCCSRLVSTSRFLASRALGFRGLGCEEVGDRIGELWGFRGLRASWFLWSGLWTEALGLGFRPLVRRSGPGTSGIGFMMKGLSNVALSDPNRVMVILYPYYGYTKTIRGIYGTTRSLCFLLLYSCTQSSP